MMTRGERLDKFLTWGLKSAYRLRVLTDIFGMEPYLQLLPYEGDQYTYMDKGGPAQSR